MDITADAVEPSPLLMTEMGITREDIADRLRLVEFTADDAANVASVAGLIEAGADEFVTVFLEHVRSHGRGGLSHPDSLAEMAGRLKAEHLRAMARGTYDANYVRQRIMLGSIYAKAGLEPRTLLAAYHRMVRRIGSHIMRAHHRRPDEGFAAFLSLSKVASFDVALIVDVILFERQRLIELQQHSIRELSTPVLQIRERLLVLPIIGLIDTARARQLTGALLPAIRSHRAKVVIVDVTGVPFIESDVAHYLLRTVVETAQLLGTRVIITGVSADAAQSVVASMVDFASVRTAGDLQTAVEEAERLLDR